MGNGISGPGFCVATSQQIGRIQNLVIRPKRKVYHQSELGPTTFSFGGVLYHRTDFDLRNPRGLMIRCSHWHQVGGRYGGFGGGGTDSQPPCVVYLHANSGSRLESRDILTWSLMLGMSFCAFDFTGSGLSEGEHVSLGWYEQQDLRVVLDHLHSTGRAGSIILWGRSMGASTAVMFGDTVRNKMEVVAMVLDSPFSCFRQIATEKVNRAREVGFVAPGCMVPALISFYSASIMTTAGFDPSNCDPLSLAPRATIPALFLVAQQDEMFPASTHGQLLYQRYGGPKGLLSFTGEHNSRRPPGIYDTATKFITPVLRIPPGTRIPQGVAPHNSMRPPWDTPSASAQSCLGTWFGLSKSSFEPGQQTVLTA